MVRPLIAILVAAALLGVAGCDDDGGGADEATTAEETTPTTATPSQGIVDCLEGVGYVVEARDPTLLRVTSPSRIFDGARLACSARFRGYPAPFGERAVHDAERACARSQREAEPHLHRGHLEQPHLGLCQPRYV